MNRRFYFAALPLTHTASGYMEGNLYILRRLPFFPTRSRDVLCEPDNLFLKYFLADQGLIFMWQFLPSHLPHATLQRFLLKAIP